MAEKNLSQRLIYLREMKELTREQLAEELGLSCSAIAKYENIENETDLQLLKVLKVFANYYKVSIDFLVGNVDEEKDNIKIQVLFNEFYKLTERKQNYILTLLQNINKMERR